MRKFYLTIQILLFTVIFNELQAQYCIPVYTHGCELGDGLTHFSLNTISQAIPCSGIPNYYHDYTAISTDLAKTGYYLISAKSSSAGLYVSVWIDYDDNTTFNNAEELVQQFVCTTIGVTYSVPITIPASATTGTTRLRILS
ncbi:MAG: GEVED domain-containing protein, partial [Bacteroidota bacterium]